METTPVCLGFIMDGNRRWAKEQGLTTAEGHTRGMEVFLDCVRFVRDAGIPHAVFYAFSTENWNRSPEEVSHLMNIFLSLIIKMKQTAEEERVRVRFIGARKDFSPELQKEMNELEHISLAYGATTVWVALSYGGRAEIVAAVNEAVARGAAVDEQTFESLLWTAELPDPDMIVRTSGEKRLSNFLTWKSTYSELHFIEKHWPALTKADFEDILLQYAKRDRRKGK
ncbi:MAG TPA: polyprenyl diphosphate synthase [Candidatus Paceibacterota bacterium]